MPTWSYSGSLPPGLVFSQQGMLFGVPTQSGRFTFTITANNNFAPADSRQIVVDILSCGLNYIGVIENAINAFQPTASVNLALVDGMIRGIPPRMTVGYIANLPEVATVRNANGTPRTTGNVGTETVIVFANGPELTVVVYGDANGDGNVNNTDLMFLRMFLAGQFTPSASVMEAFDTNGNGSVNNTDLMFLRMYLAGQPITLGSQP